MPMPSASDAMSLYKKAYTHASVILQVVERLISLPVEFWSRFMMVEQENIDPGHIIENSNAYSTPCTPDVKGNQPLLKLY